MSKMFVHSGTALHRHEYSPAVERSNSTPSRSPLSRAAIPSPIKRRSTIPEKPSPIIRTRSSQAESLKRNPEQLVRFQNEEYDTMDEDDGRSVITTSDNSDFVRSERSRRKSSTPKSHYTFAYPPATQLSKQRLLQIRPKKLLQVQHIPPGSRPMPVIDVLPSTTFLPRLLKRYPRMFRGKAELGANDVIIVKSESYDTTEDDPNADSESDEENLSNRELMAVICQARKDAGGSLGRAEIALTDGSSWIASPLGNDSFELVKIDEHGNRSTARWSRRPLKSKRLESLADNEQSSEQEYTFSMIDPNKRRHPIIATLTRNTLRINDYYFPVEPPSAVSAGSSPTRNTIYESQDPSAQVIEKTPIMVDEMMKILIHVSSIWIGLRKGWCSYFTYRDTTPSSSVRSRVASSTTCRPLSLPLTTNNLSTGVNRSGTPEPVRSPLTVVGEKLRFSCPMGTTTPVANPIVQPQAPQRSVSSGSAFMQRTTAKRGYSYPSMTNGSVDDYSAANWRRAGESEEHVDGISKPAALPSESNSPSKPRRRPKSTALPTNGHRDRSNRPTGPEPDGPVISAVDIVKKAKISRWKAFTNIFRRTAR